NVDDPQVLAGKALFHQAGCQSCHTPTFTTGEAEEPELAHQLIRPYTDLLLHDMGEGLADNRPEFEASGSEWRTPPLWGIGLTQAVSGHTQFLHDGRARNLLEAVLWHGGEAERSRQLVLGFNAEQRNALLAFLESLWCSISRSQGTLCPSNRFCTPQPLPLSACCSAPVRRPIPLAKPARPWPAACCCRPTATGPVPTSAWRPAARHFAATARAWMTRVRPLSRHSWPGLNC